MLSTRLSSLSPRAFSAVLPQASTYWVAHRSSQKPRQSLIGSSRGRTWGRHEAGLSARSYSSHASGSTIESAGESFGRSYLYVPATAERMLEKSLTTTSDVIIYDLEDSVPPSPADKNGARARLAHFLSTRVGDLPSHERIAVRLNSNATPFFADDILQAMRLPCIRTLVLPKIHSARDLDHVSEEIFLGYKGHKLRNPDGPHVQIVASIESAQAMHNLGEIAGWQSKYGAALGGTLSALLFAAEDYCADTGIIRTTSRQELLYTRSHIVVTAKAFRLKAIDMVCVNYKDLRYLRDECEDGRRLGFTGKQAIHPSQVDVIQSTFVPSSKGPEKSFPACLLRAVLTFISLCCTEILRAARILKQMEKAHLANRGAAGLELEGGGMEMIDAPMIKQAENVVRIAKAAGLDIPDVQ
ncbi:Pyruvate/Phosphoenolpyruvate kinase-like domain-containing protein [Trametes gibbosa]|nr:Pyruvate/Phosphoenolpyruvate kinase-like domain-containing protein [Trametes gibbosa]